MGLPGYLQDIFWIKKPQTLVFKRTHIYWCLCILKALQSKKCSQVDYFFKLHLLGISYVYFQHCLHRGRFGFICFFKLKNPFLFSSWERWLESINLWAGTNYRRSNKNKQNSKWYRIYIKHFFSPFLLRHREGTATENESETAKLLLWLEKINRPFPIQLLIASFLAPFSEAIGSRHFFLQDIRLQKQGDLHQL